MHGVQFGLIFLHDLLHAHNLAATARNLEQHLVITDCKHLIEHGQLFQVCKQRQIAGSVLFELIFEVFELLRYCLVRLTEFVEQIRDGLTLQENSVVLLGSVFKFVENCFNALQTVVYLRHLARQGRCGLLKRRQIDRSGFSFVPNETIIRSYDTTIYSVYFAS